MELCIFRKIVLMLIVKNICQCSKIVDQRFTVLLNLFSLNCSTNNLNL